MFCELILFQDKFTNNNKNNNNNNNNEMVLDESKAGWVPNSFWSWWRGNKMLLLTRIEHGSYSSLQLWWNVRRNFVLDTTNNSSVTKISPHPPCSPVTDYWESLRRKFITLVHVPSIRLSAPFQLSPLRAVSSRCRLWADDAFPVFIIT
jgi:hypothetical protein